MVDPKPRARCALAPFIAVAFCALGLWVALPERPARRGPPAGFVAVGGVRSTPPFAPGPRAATPEPSILGGPAATSASSTGGWLPSLAASLGLAAAFACARGSRIVSSAKKDWKIRWCGRVKPSGGGTGKHGVRPTDTIGCAKIYDRWKRRWRCPELLYSETALYTKNRNSKRELRWRQWRAGKRAKRALLKKGEIKERVEFIQRQRKRDAKGLTLGLHFDIRDLATWIDVDVFKKSLNGPIVRLERQRDQLGFPCPPVRLTDHVFKVLDGKVEGAKASEMGASNIKPMRPLGTINKERMARKAAKAARRLTRRKKGV